jgi:hypothetical protein
MHIGFWSERHEQREHKEDLDVGGRTIIKWILRDVGWDGMDMIDLAQNRDQWRALVNTVMNFRIP